MVGVAVCMTWRVRDTEDLSTAKSFALVGGSADPSILTEWES